jgi:hypothetical protein
MVTSWEDRMAAPSHVRWLARYREQQARDAENEPADDECQDGGSGG